MIYRNEVLINWKNPVTKDDRLVSEEITEIRNKYFGDKGKGVVKLLYPRGEPKMENGGGFEILKIFPIPLNSADGEWRWSKSRMTSKSKSYPSGFVDHHYNIRHQHPLTDKDIELIWFLMNRSSVLNKKIFIEDLEGKAAEKVKELASDADIRFMIMGAKSPIAKDEKLIRDVALVFGVRDAEKMQLNELKLALYNKVVEGEKANDAFVNFERFEAITEGNTMRKSAFVARMAINDGIVGYKDRAWWLMSGRDYTEKLLDLKQSEVQYREQIFIDEVVKNPNVRDRLFSAIGENEGVTCGELRDLDRQTLVAKYKGLTGKFENGKKEEVLKLVCEAMGIEYVPV